MYYTLYLGTQNWQNKMKHSTLLYWGGGWSCKILWGHIYPAYILFVHFRFVESGNSLLYIVQPADNGNPFFSSVALIKRENGIFWEETDEWVLVVLIRFPLDLRIRIRALPSIFLFLAFFFGLPMNQFYGAIIITFKDLKDLEWVSVHRGTNIVEWSMAVKEGRSEGN